MLPKSYSRRPPSVSLERGEVSVAVGLFSGPVSTILVYYTLSYHVRTQNFPAGSKLFLAKVKNVPDFWPLIAGMSDRVSTLPSAEAPPCYQLRLEERANLVVAPELVPFQEMPCLPGLFFFLPPSLSFPGSSGEFAGIRRASLQGYSNKVAVKC